ncbi:MAG: hypothetical protein AABX05_05810, partial [Nanoarchaeota archaeon]
KVIEKVTGKKRGEVSPILATENLADIDAVYFTRDLIADAVKFSGKRYDFPRSLSESEFFNAADLFGHLAKINPKYRTAAEFEKTSPLQIVRWRVKEVDAVKTGYRFLFDGTIVNYRGRDYEIKNPRMKKEGVLRRRKQINCMAMPLSYTPSGIKHEYTERGRKRVFLPISYETLEQMMVRLEK